MDRSFPEKTNFVIHEGRRGDSVVYLISRLPGRMRKNLHQYRHRSARGAAQRNATIYRYTINHFGSYLGVLARDKSSNGRIPAKRDGTKWTIRMKYNGADENFSGQKRPRDFPRPRRHRIRELASQNGNGNHSSINYIVSHFSSCLRTSFWKIYNGYHE